MENTDSEGTTLNGITLIIPSNFADSDANFQSQQLDKSTVLETLSAPHGQSMAENLVYELRAVTEDSTVISEFDEPLTMTITYTTDDIEGMKEDTLQIYSSDGESDWAPLSACSVDTDDKTVTCDTPHFSVFALFGEEEDSVPTITTPTVNTITTTSATLGANVTSVGIPPDTLTARGTCW